MSSAYMFSLVPRSEVSDRDDLEFEYGNAWGGAARIWKGLSNKQGMEFSKILMSGELDDLYVEDMPTYDKVALALTCDHSYIDSANVETVSEMLAQFDDSIDLQGVNHLPAWSEDMLELSDRGAGAIAFHHTSVSVNPWIEHPEPCKHDPNPEPVYLTTEDGYSVCESVPELEGSEQ